MYIAWFVTHCGTMTSCGCRRFWEGLGVPKGTEMGIEGIAFNSSGSLLVVQRKRDRTSYTCTIVECTVTGSLVRCVLPLGQIVRPAGTSVIKFAAASLLAAVLIVRIMCIIVVSTAGDC